MAFNLDSAFELSLLGQPVATTVTPVVAPVRLPQGATLRPDQRGGPNPSPGPQGLPNKGPEAASRPSKQGDSSITPTAREVYMTTPQAADYLKCTPRWLERLRQKGGGPIYSKLSERKVLYAKASLDAWVEASLCQHTSEKGRFSGCQRRG